jgi:hypothetical protein
MSERMKDNFRRRVNSLLKYIDGKAPDFLIANQLALVWFTGSALFGERLYLELGKRLTADARQRCGLCNGCDEDITVEDTHYVYCPMCEAKQESASREIERQADRQMEEIERDLMRPE